MLHIIFQADTSPRESKLNKQDQDLHLEIDETGLACKSEVKKRWLGARGTAGLYGNGKYYYEVTITSKGLCRVGWATLGGSLNIGNTFLHCAKLFFIPIKMFQVKDWIVSVMVGLE